MNGSGGLGVDSFTVLECVVPHFLSQMVPLFCRDASVVVPPSSLQRAEDYTCFQLSLYSPHVLKVCQNLTTGRSGPSELCEY